MKVTRLNSYSEVLDAVAKDVANFPVESVTAQDDPKQRTVGFVLRVEGAERRIEVAIAHVIYGARYEPAKSWWWTEPKIREVLRTQPGRQRIADALARGVKPADLNEALA